MFYITTVVIQQRNVFAKAQTQTQKKEKNGDCMLEEWKNNGKITQN